MILILKFKMLEMIKIIGEIICKFYVFYSSDLDKIWDIRERDLSVYKYIYMYLLMEVGCKRKIKKISRWVFFFKRICCFVIN